MLLIFGSPVVVDSEIVHVILIKELINEFIDTNDQGKSFCQVSNSYKCSIIFILIFESEEKSFAHELL